MHVLLSVSQTAPKRHGEPNHPRHPLDLVLPDDPATWPQPLSSPRAGTFGRPPGLSRSSQAPGYHHALALVLISAHIGLIFKETTDYVVYILGRDSIALISRAGWWGRSKKPERITQQSVGAPGTRCGKKLPAVCSASRDAAFSHDGLFC